MSIKPDDGVILSEQDKAQLGTSFIQIASGLVGIGAPIKTAIDVASKFVPSAEIDEETMNELTAGEGEGMDDEMWDTMQQGREMPEGSF